MVLNSHSPRKKTTYILAVRQIIHLPERITKKKIRKEQQNQQAGYQLIKARSQQDAKWLLSFY